MSARHKLNVTYFNGCLLLAALIGMAASSWPVFLLALIVFVISSLHTGEIRIDRH